MIHLALPGRLKTIISAGRVNTYCDNCLRDPPLPGITALPLCATSVSPEVGVIIGQDFKEQIITPFESSGPPVNPLGASVQEDARGDFCFRGREGSCYDWLGGSVFIEIMVSQNLGQADSKEESSAQAAYLGTFRTPSRLSA